MSGFLRKAGGGSLNGQCALETSSNAGMILRVMSDRLRRGRPFERFPEVGETPQEERTKSATVLILACEIPRVHATVQADAGHHRMSTRKRRESVGRLPRSLSWSIPLRRLQH